MRSRTGALLLIVLVVVVALATRSSLGADGGGAAVRPDEGTVVRVVDGDTVVVRLGRSQESVRLIGIDTPESVDPRTPVECFGRDAAAQAAALLPAGTTVRLVRDVEARDRYDRLLAYVYRQPDDLFVNLALVRAGYAGVATYPPNVAHTDAFVAAAAEARAAGAGLWSACSDPP